MKRDLGTILGGVALTAAALWLAWDGYANGALDLPRRLGGFRLALADNPLGFWLGEAGLLVVALLFAIGTLVSLKPETPPER